MAEIGSILYATDFSDLSKVALDYAVLLARRCQAQLHCLHVVDDSYQYWLSLEVATIPAGPSAEELEQAANKEFDKFLAGNVPDDVPVRRAVRRGRPFVEIIRYTRENGVGLIVMGTHGRSGLSHVLMGSVSEKVVRKSPCPVMTVRDPGHDFEMP